MNAGGMPALLSQKSESNGWKPLRCGNRRARFGKKRASFTIVLLNGVFIVSDFLSAHFMTGHPYAFLAVFLAVALANPFSKEDLMIVSVGLSWSMT